MKSSLFIACGLLVLLLSGCQSAKTGLPSSTSLPAPSRTPGPTQVGNPTSNPDQTAAPGEASPTIALSPTATITEVNAVATQPAASPTPPNPPVSVQTAQDSGCIDRATFERDVTIPDDTVFQPGETFIKTWRLYNSGTCAWEEGYSIDFAYGDAMQAPLSSPLPATQPGASVEVSLDMTAPGTAGQHAGNWQLHSSSGEHFGVGQSGADYFWVQVVVSFAGASSAADAAPAGSAHSSGNNPATAPNGCPYTGDPQAEDEILGQINSIRSLHSLDALSRPSQLDAAAMDYSLDMACNNRVDFTRHTDSQGGRWYERIAAQGYAYSKAFENVYTGNPQYGGTAQGAINWWMNSQIHRDNILNPDVTQIGIAYAYTDTSDYGGYYTVDFATP